MKKVKHKLSGFTLIEMILVLAIMSSVILLVVNYTAQKTDQLKRETIAIEIQQILNSALSFYVTNGAWPGGLNPTAACSASAITFGGTTTNQLQGQGYLPSTLPTNAGNAYKFTCNTSTGLFTVSILLSNAQDASMIAGLVPLGTVSGNTVSGSVNIPGQNLNNARSLNFAGLYYSSSCVPAPTCPSGMTPQIFVTPASVSGLTAPPSCGAAPQNPPYTPDSSCTASVFPIESFVAYARGDSSGAPTDPIGAPNNNPNANGNIGPPLDCTFTTTPHTQFCNSYTAGGGWDVAMVSDGTLYWRVCLHIMTENGDTYPGGSSVNAILQGKMMGTVAVFTRCVPANEPSGSNNIWDANYSSGTP